MQQYGFLSMFQQYTKVTVKSWFQYRVDAVLRSFAVFLREATGIIVIYMTLLKFDSLNGWNMKEMLFLFSLLFFTYGILIIFFTGLRDFDELVRGGGFDRFLLRPRGALFQVISSNSDWFAALGHGVLGIVLFILSANQVGIVWNLVNVIYYVLAVIGGVLIQGAIFLFFASLSFYVVKADELRSILYWNLRRMAGYPLSIFSKWIQYLLLYVIPFAFVNYFPAQYLLRKEDLSEYPSCYLYLTPILGIGLYLLSYLFWRVSLTHYKSTGN